MPCYGPTEDDIRDSERRSGRYGILKRGELEAIVCGLLRTGKVALDDVDWDQAGVSREYAEQWWAEHQAEDAKRVGWL